MFCDKLRKFMQKPCNDKVSKTLLVQTFKNLKLRSAFQPNAQHRHLVSVFSQRVHRLPPVIDSLHAHAVIRSWIGELSGHSSFLFSPPLSPYPHPSCLNHWPGHINKINTHTLEESTCTLTQTRRGPHTHTLQIYSSSQDKQNTHTELWLLKNPTRTHDIKQIFTVTVTCRWMKGEKSATRNSPSCWWHILTGV